MGGRQGENSESVRRRNLSTLLGHVHRAGELSRSVLADSMGVSRSTVAGLVADLAARGLVGEGDAVGRGQRGRPSTLIRPAADAPTVLAADIEVASIGFAVAGLGGVVHQRVRVDRAPDHRGPQETVDHLRVLIREALAAHNGRPPLALGVAVPGLVRRHDGFVPLAPNLGWRDVPLGEMLAAELPDGVPVTIGNDADLGALAEHTRGAGVGVDDLLYLSSEVGVGGGVIIGGRPFTGAAGFAGEVGHVVVNPGGVECTCGGRGCLETECGEWALLRHMGWSPGFERQAVDAVLREAAAGSSQALGAVEEVGRWLGIGLAGLVNVFNPNRVVLGGFFARLFPYLGNTLRRQLDVYGQRPNREMVTVVAATLGEDSPLLGAVELALAPLLADPTSVPALAVTP